jgi:hypothetical protein
VADLLLGIPSSASIATPTIGDLRQRYYGFYVRDDWQVTNNLTLNLGLRWDMSSPFWDHHNRMSNFIMEPGRSAVVITSLAVSSTRCNRAISSFCNASRLICPAGSDGTLASRDSKGNTDAIIVLMYSLLSGRYSASCHRRP